MFLRPTVKNTKNLKIKEDSYAKLQKPVFTTVLS